MALCATDADNGKAMFLSVVGVFLKTAHFQDHSVIMD